MPSPIRETATGFARTGDWFDIVEHGERVTCALIELDAPRDVCPASFAAWDRWRPKAHERLRTDVGVRTADLTSHSDGDRDDPRWRRALRRAERFLYLHVMTLASPYYFDTRVIHASVDRHGWRQGRHRYTLDVAIADDDLRAQVRDRLHEYESDVPRWHLAATVTTDAAVDAEGYDLSAGETADVPLRSGVNLSQVAWSHADDD